MRSRKHWRLPIILWALLLAHVEGLRADEGSVAASASLRQPAGATTRYEYHFNRNSLRDSQRAGNALVAVTNSGNLLRFDFETRKLTREWFGPSMVVCLGRGEGDSVLAGFEDGRVCRVNPATLSREEIAKLPGKPQWIGFAAGGQQAPGRLVAVVEQSRWVEEDGQRWREKYSAVLNLATGQAYATSRLATTFLLDSKHRLWLGGDRGEWGGWCSYVDLDAGKLSSIRGIRRVVKDLDLDLGEVWDGVYGFVELQDGQVWAYGGVSHMGFNEAFVRRVDEGKAEELFRSDNSVEIGAFNDGKDAPRPRRPCLPITHIIETRGDEFLVFSYSDLFRTDSKLTRWTRAHDLNIQYRWGRPDSVGSYPSITAVHRLEGQGGGLLCATALNGYVLIVEDKEVHYAIPNQLGTDDIVRADSTEGGMLFREWDGEIPPWRYEAGEWSQDPSAPEEEAEPDGFGFVAPPSMSRPGSAGMDLAACGWPSEVFGWPTCGLGVSMRSARCR